jgi:hypothetical protein
MLSIGTHLDIHVHLLRGVLFALDQAQNQFLLL